MKATPLRSLSDNKMSLVFLTSAPLRGKRTTVLSPNIIPGGVSGGGARSGEGVWGRQEGSCCPFPNWWDIFSVSQR